MRPHRTILVAGVMAAALLTNAGCFGSNTTGESSCGQVIVRELGSEADESADAPSPTLASVRKIGEMKPDEEAYTGTRSLSQDKRHERGESHEWIDTTWQISATPSSLLTVRIVRRADGYHVYLSKKARADIQQYSAGCSSSGNAGLRPVTVHEQ